MKTLNNFKTIDKEISSDRKEYLEYCKTKALNIFNKLKIDIAEDMKDKGKAFVHVVGRYDNIFLHRIAGLIAEKFRNEGLELQLFNSIGIVKIFIKE